MRGRGVEGARSRGGEGKRGDGGQGEIRHRKRGRWENGRVMEGFR